MLGVAPFALLELILALADPDLTSADANPFIGFRGAEPLFVLDDTGRRYEIARRWREFFRPESFAAEKDPAEYRIFCLGGSTVQGRPFAVETSFTTWLELGLDVADSRRRWEVVNCGGISYASYRLVLILDEVLGYEPDLVVIYAGHNEFLEDRTYGHIKRLPEIIARPFELLSGLRTVRMLRAACSHMTGRAAGNAPKGRPILESEVDALLDHRGGLEHYRRDEGWRLGVVEHFRYSLRLMLEKAREAGVPVILANPVSNLRDCPPFKSQHRDGLTAGEIEQLRSLRGAAARSYGTNMRGALGFLEKAVAIDDQHAGIRYELARCYDALGMMDAARRAYEQAKELDVCPLRILEPMNEIVLEVARTTAAPLVDVRAKIEELSRDGITGSEWLIDHVHPTIRGHQLIADLLIQEMTRQGISRPVPGWKDERDRRYREHYASLDDLYFAKGVQRLENVRRWAQGRVGTYPGETDAEDSDGDHGVRR